MKARFTAINENNFMTPASLDEISISPYLLQSDLQLNPQTVEIFENYGINRKLTSNYICHWKDLLIKNNIINSESLSFQEDESFIKCFLDYPHRVKDCSMWSTVYLYGLKLLTSVSGAALNLYRGTTDYPGLSDHAVLTTASDFATSINHACASLTSYQRVLPDLDYNNEGTHGGEMLYHISSLKKSEDSLCIHFSASNVYRYPITLGIDEQEINAGTFVRDGVLHGLEKKMTANEIREIGLNNFCKYKAEKNNFITGVREYRATDLRDKVCSNVKTEFVSHELSGRECSTRLEDCIKFASKCRMCLMDRVPCNYDVVDQSCQNCQNQNMPCVSLFVFLVLWDMGSGHKKVDQFLNVLDADSSNSELLSSKTVTIGFGGLHLAKSFVCTARNYVLSHDGQKFGVNILHELKQMCGILKSINNSVFVGRDKQSDLLNYTLIGEKVQQSLKTWNHYLITRVPEKYLTYKENAKTQKRIIMPSSIDTNRNGDVFLVDAGASCVFVVDNSSVAKVKVLEGQYGSPSILP